MTNSFGEPARVEPSASKFKAAAPKFAYKFPALSLTILEWPAIRAAKGD